MATAPGAAELTIDRLFEAPALAGPSLLGLKISPDGSRVTYLQGKPEDKDCLDLWEYDLRAGRARMLVDSRGLGADPGNALGRGVGTPRAAKNRGAVRHLGILLCAFGPRPAVYARRQSLPLRSHPAQRQTRSWKSTPRTALRRTRPFHPAGGYIAFVRDQNLHVYDIAKAQGKALTSDGGGAIKNGMAEFVAQEEMDRATGYWWAPDDRHIAFARVDETPVEVTERFEIAADNVRTFAQRYPVAGGRNVLVRVGVVDVHTGAVTWIDLGPETDIYLARVNWLPDGKTLAIQRQSRDQRRLDLLFADIDTGHSRIVLTEVSETWVDLHHELSFLTQSREFIWASSRDGYQHLYLYDD